MKKGDYVYGGGYSWNYPRIEALFEKVRTIVQSLGEHGMYRDVTIGMDYNYSSHDFMIVFRSQEVLNIKYHKIDDCKFLYAITDTPGEWEEYLDELIQKVADKQTMAEEQRRKRLGGK